MSIVMLLPRGFQTGNTVVFTLLQNHSRNVRMVLNSYYEQGVWFGTALKLYTKNTGGIT